MSSRTRIILLGAAIFSAAVLIAYVDLSGHVSSLIGGPAQPGNETASTRPHGGTAPASAAPGAARPDAPKAARGAPPPQRPASPETASALANRLGSAASPYLRLAAGQPVFWQVFDGQAFQLAQALDRPILLDVGGTWCHWCRVMGEESYSDPAVAALINQYFVPVKIDADERPDLDRRYQQVAQAVAQEAGWPLTLFLTPHGDAFAGGTYFPAQERAGRASLRSMLTKLADSYHEQQDVIAIQGAQIDHRLTMLRETGVVRGALRPELVEELAQPLLSYFDPANGGFGRGAKFPATQAIELALQQYGQHGDRQYLAVATKTLDAMAAGGIRDQLSGAFHRYTLDPRWQVPHFELIGSLNAAILVTYLHAYQVIGDNRYRIVAERAIDYLSRTLVDRDQGWFYSGQDADTGAGDDGGYYTWTAEEIKAALPPDEVAVFIRYYGVPEPAAGIKLGDGPPAGRNVLYTAQPVAEVARALGLPEDQVRGYIESGRAHLRVARDARRAPPVDHSLFADRNGVLATAYFEAARVLGRSDLRDIAVRALDRLLMLPRQDGLLAHSYVDQGPAARGMLDDQVAVSAALLDAFAATGERRYLEAAGELLDRTIAVFGDRADGGFYDVAASSELGAAGARQRPFDDGITLGGNPLAAMTLDRYAAMADNADYRAYAAETLQAFAGAAREYAPFASGYALALSYHLGGQ